MDHATTSFAIGTANSSVSTRPARQQHDWMITTSAVREGATARFDGARSMRREIDTDPFVYAIGFPLSEDVVVTPCCQGTS